MSRELKFRAWVNEHWVDWLPNYTTLGVYNEVGIYADEYSTEAKCYIEQYTGIKDKNGKEIYEGDIIKFADLELAMKPIGVVCFAYGEFCVKDFEFDDGSYHIVEFYDYNIPNRDFEVIGNIHENPELLGGEE